MKLKAIFKKALRAAQAGAIAGVLLGLAGGAQAFAKPTNKSLTIGVSQEFEILNPAIKQMVASTYIHQMVGRPLVWINSDWKWYPVLAKEIPSLENKKAKLITEGGQKKIISEWEIKENAKWGDGTPITGHDVHFTQQVYASPNVSSGDKEVASNMEEIAVDAKNPKKFTIKFKEARYDFATLGTFDILPKHVEGPVFEKTKNQNGAYEKQTTYSTNPYNPGLYSGPYKVKEIKLGSHVVLEPNPHYYGKKPKIERIVFKVIPNTQALEANLLSGTIDMISELGPTFDQAIALEKRITKDPSLKSQFKVLFREGMTYEHIDLNLRNPILQDLKVRQALVYAINRDKLTQALFEGRQKPALHNIHPLDPYYTDKVEKFAYNPKKAEELLDAAGWKKGADGIRRKDGQKLTFVLMTTADNKTRELVQVFLQNEWKQVGIETQIKNEPARVYFGETVRKGAYPHMAMFAWSSSPDNLPKTTCHSSQIPSEKNGFSGQNSGAWSNKRMDELLDAAQVEFNTAKRTKLVHEMQKVYAEQVPIIPLYLRAEIAVVPTNLKNFRLSGHQFYSTQFVENWDLQ